MLKGRLKSVSDDLLMKNGSITAAGATADIMDAERLSQTYDWRILECTANGKTWFQAETL